MSPLRVMRNASRFGLTTWRVEARDGARRALIDVEAQRDALAGVTYTDPDGEHAYCYNSETASMQVRVWNGDDLLARSSPPPGAPTSSTPSASPCPAPSCT